MGEAACNGPSKLLLVALGVLLWGLHGVGFQIVKLSSLFVDDLNDVFVLSLRFFKHILLIILGVETRAFSYNRTF